MGGERGLAAGSRCQDRQRRAQDTAAAATATERARSIRGDGAVLCDAALVSDSVSVFVRAGVKRSLYGASVLVNRTIGLVRPSVSRKG